MTDKEEMKMRKSVFRKSAAAVLAVTLAAAALTGCGIINDDSDTAIATITADILLCALIMLLLLKINKRDLCFTISLS